MENESYKLDGVKEVIDALKDLPQELQVKVLKGFLQKVGRSFIVQPLKVAIPYKQLHMRDKSPVTNNEFIRVTTDSRTPLSVSAGVTSKGYKLRWLDKGTKLRVTKKGHSRGQIVGKNIIQPLIEDQIPKIVEYTEKEIGNEIDKALSRRLKKLKKSL